jgi:hypothetical protein
MLSIELNRAGFRKRRFGSRAAVRLWPRYRRAAICAATVILAALSLSLAGCGNEKRDFRVDKLEPLIQRVRAQRAELASALRLAQPHRARDAEILRSQVARLAAAMRQVAVLVPPDGTERQFQRYTRANAALLASLSRFIEAFASRVPALQRRAGRAAQSAVIAANRAQVELQHALN